MLVILLIPLLIPLLLLAPQGSFSGIVDPGEENSDSQGRAVDEYGKKFR